MLFELVPKPYLVPATYAVFPADRGSTETSAFAVVSATAASAGLFGCSNVCFNRRIQEKFQFKKD